MRFNTQGEVSNSYVLAPVHTSSISSISQPSSCQDGVSSSTFGTKSSRVGHLDDPLLGARDGFAHLTLIPLQQNNTSDPNSERARELKALPACEDVKEITLKSIDEWGMSFEQTEQEHLFEDLEPLEVLKKKTNKEMIQNQFETLVKFTAGVKSCFEDFQELRKHFDDLASAKNATVAGQIEAVLKLNQGLRENAKMFTKNSDVILGCYSDIWKFQRISVKETQEKIESILCAEHDHQEDVQFTLDMLKDGERLAPRIKEPSGLVTAFLEGTGKYGFLKLAKKHRDKQQGSKMLQAAYQGEKSKTNALSQRLDQSRNSLRTAQTTLASLCTPIYMTICVFIDKHIVDGNIVSVMAITNTLDETEGKLLTLLELIEGFLAQITQEYGVEFGTREVKRLCFRLPNIFTALEMLLSAKEVVADDRKYIYEEHICELCKAILEHFNIMREVRWECGIVVDVERQAAFLRDDLPRFHNSVTPRLQGIMDIAEAHISKTKSKEANMKRAKDDRYHGDSALARPGRPLVTGDEIVWALYKVIDALLLIQAVSSASTASDKRAGEADCTKGTGANGSLAWLKMPEEMSLQFYAVLFDEAKKLEVLKDQGERKADAKPHEESEPEGNLARLRRLLARKLL